MSGEPSVGLHVELLRDRTGAKRQEGKVPLSILNTTEIGLMHRKQR
jgi:hypothetical protein